MNNDLKKSVLATIVFFDFFEYPLKLDEIWTYLVDMEHKITAGQINQTQIEYILQVLETENKIQTQDSYYFLVNRQEIVLTRQHRHQESLRKIKKVQRATKFLSLLPYVKSVSVCNVLGYLNAKQQDDLDLLIVTSQKHIWTARFFATGFFKIFNLRPTKRTVQDRFCFSFYVAEDGLNLASVALKNDIYFYFWLTQLIPIYDQDNYFEKLIDSNSWVSNFMLNFKTKYALQNLDEYKIKPLAGWFKKFWEGLFFKNCEKFFRWWQKKWMPQILKNLSKDNVGVIINDKILKFHVQDRRRGYYESWKLKCKELEN